MAVEWPAFLQDKLNETGFNLTYGDTTLRSSMETGAAKVRARTTKRIDVFTCTITIDRSQFEDWDNFFTIDLANGTNPFAFNHPLSGVPSVFRFSKPPSIPPMGGTYFSVTMEWESIP